MTPQLCRALRSEVELVARFSESYRRKFGELIGRLNHGGDPHADQQSVRLCVEAVDMMLSTHHLLAKALSQLTDEAERLAQRQQAEPAAQPRTLRAA